MLRRRWTKCLATIGMSLLSGCAKENSEPNVRLVCPDLVEYSKETQQRAAEEIEQSARDSVLVECALDYGKLRGQIRECHAGNR